MPSRITILAVSHKTEPFLKTAEAEYLSRLAPFAEVDIRYIPPEDATTLGAEKATHKENTKLQAALPKGAHLIACDRSGTLCHSEDLARPLSHHAHLCYLIGGSHGLLPDTLALCQQRIAFGHITLPHQLFRIVLLEQLYRGWTILKHMHYHK